jgi:hypothetical protein
MNAISIAATLMLSTMMYFMGKELCSWAPPWFRPEQRGSLYYGWSVADRPRPHHVGLLAIAQVSHRSQSRWLDL